MTLYRYKAVSQEGKLYRGTLEATSSLELRKELDIKGLFLITCSSYFLKIPSFSSGKIKISSLIDLCLHLEQFEKAGVPLKEGLEELSHVQDTPKFKLILLEIAKDLEKGILFSQALTKHPSTFDSVFVGLMAVGEKTGQLSFVLQQLSQHLRWIDEIEAQVFKALRYPLMMALLLGGVIFILMTVLVPELVVFIKSFKRDLPFSTRLLITFSSFFSDHLFILLGGLLGICLIIKAFFKIHPHGLLWKNRFQEILPFIGSLQRKIALARFCHLFAVMFGGGIDILQAFQTARKSLVSESLTSSLREVEEFVREGQSLSKAFEKTKIFPPMVVRMIKIGEQTSALQANLFHVKAYFDITLKRQVDYVIGLVEPFMILSVGLMMGWIVYSIFLPLYEILALVD